MIMFSEADKIKMWNKIVPMNICGEQMYECIKPRMVVEVLGKAYRISMELSDYVASKQVANRTKIIRSTVFIIYIF
jgi:hypothetical protein